MRKRERENPCGLCGHYHRYEEGEVCGVCGHRPPLASQGPIQLGGAFPSEILKDFLYLGSYDNASRGELLNTLGISRILNTVPTCQTFYRNSFAYHCLEDGSMLQFDNANQFLEECNRENARVLVHCMSGKNRSPAIVIAYLMKSKGWRFRESFQWVKERRPMVELSSASLQQLIEYEKKVFESSEQTLAFPSPSSPFGFTYPKPGSLTTIPAFNQLGSTLVFNRAFPDASSNEFVFGASESNEQAMVTNSTETNGLAAISAGTRAPMDDG